MSYRKIKVDDEVWLWKIGRSNVYVRDPNGKGHHIDFSKLTGLTWDDIERRQYKHAWFTITPKDVRKFIDNIKKEKRK